MLLVSLPKPLQEVALRALDAEAHLRRSPRSVETAAQRARLLRGTQDTLYAWSRGRITESEAIEQIERLILESKP